MEILFGVVQVIVVAAIVVALCKLCWWIIVGILTIPGPRNDKMLSKFREKGFIAHRGLHDRTARFPENSMAAFANAIDNGYGIELDVQTTKDNKVVVFHDDKLNRICGDEAKGAYINECTFAELSKYRLLGGEETIPLLSDVFDLIMRKGDKTPLVIEIKSAPNEILTCKLVNELISDSNVDFPVCIKSFSPKVVRWFYKNSPDTLRGILASDYKRSKKRRKKLYERIFCYFQTNLLFNFYCKPNFVSYNCSQFDQKNVRKIFSTNKELGKSGWTFKLKDTTKETLTQIRAQASDVDMIVFELEE